MKPDALSIPDGPVSGRRVSLFRSISAVQVVPNDHADHGAKLGPLLQLGAGTIIEICGGGFNERTIKVRANGHFYFVFLEDIELAHRAAAG